MRKIKRSLRCWAPKIGLVQYSPLFLKALAKTDIKPPYILLPIFSLFLAPLWFHYPPLLSQITSLPGGLSYNFPAHNNYGESKERQRVLPSSQWTCLLFEKGSKKQRVMRPGELSCLNTSQAPRCLQRLYERWECQPSTDPSTHSVLPPANKPSACRLRSPCRQEGESPALSPNTARLVTRFRNSWASS